MTAMCYNIYIQQERNYFTVIQKEYLHAIQKVGNVVQVLTYQGYDKVKKRSIKMIGSYQLGTDTAPAELMEKLDDEQKTELEAHFSEIRKANEALSKKHSLSTSVAIMTTLQQALKDTDTFHVNHDDELVSNFHSLYDDISKQLKKLGYRKIKKNAHSKQPDKTSQSLLDV